MTFETIAYTGFNTRFHCLQTPDSIPFVEAMVGSSRTPCRRR